MLSEQYRREDDDLPISDELFADIYSARTLDLPTLVASVSPDVRALLALYCYRRSHLYEIGLTIAATCDEDDLLHSGGRAGADLFQKSRQSPVRAVIASHYTNRRKVTLSTGHLREMPALE
ncbi:MAG TPA: hypothetical protein VE396_03990 [Xanthobacteraceae bacterium]|jgi:hypothetical protein|nr:hypothetical protein [Xanthobacteraceae bacterium]